MSDRPTSVSPDSSTSETAALTRRATFGAFACAGSAFGALMAGSPSIAAAAPSQARSGARAAASRDPAALAASLPIRDPAFNVRTIGRLQGDLSGRTIYSYSRGMVFGLVPGEGPPLSDYGRLIYRTEGVAVRMSRVRADGAIEERSRNRMFYRDAESGEYLSEFRNPYTGETLPVPTFRGGISGGVMTKNGPEVSANFTMESTVFNRPLQLDYTFVGDNAVVHRHAFTRWKEGSTGFQKTEMTLDAWLCDIADLANEALTMIPSSYSWTSQTEWQSWLKMRGRPGAMLWRNESFKFGSVDELPKAFVEHSEKTMPGRLREPLTWS